MVPEKIMGGVLSDFWEKNLTKKEEVTGKSQHILTKCKSHLTNLIAF